MRLDKWLEDNEYKGYEPFDGLSSYLRALTFGSCLAERILQQAVLLCPFNVRRLIGVKTRKSTKGMGFLARGYLRMWLLTEHIGYKSKATFCLDWLMENYSSGYSCYCWGNNFDYASRGGHGPKHTPTAVWTSLIGQAFLDGYEILGDERYLEVALSICTFILEVLPREKTSNGTCVSYVPYKQISIHNSNMLAAAMLARMRKYLQEDNASEVAKEAMQYSCSRQLRNGGWYYGEATTYHWIDNWHTAYNLDSLKCYIENTNDSSFKENLCRGFKFYRDSFFQEDGKPKYYFNRLHVVDIQCASQAIDTLSNFAEHDGASLELASKVANWTIKKMQDKSGYFHYRKLRWKKVKVPMLHWGQATMFCALSQLLSKINSSEDSE